MSELRAQLSFKCPKCDALRNYSENCRIEEGVRILFCSKCGWEQIAPLPSRYVNYKPDIGRFVTKWGEPKKTRAIRLTDEAWENLEQIALSYGVNRADLLEIWARGILKDEFSYCALEQLLKTYLLQWATKLS